MPQMSPMWWTILFINFIMSFMIMNSMIFFYKKSKFHKNNSNKKEQPMNWKW